MEEFEKELFGIFGEFTVDVQQRYSLSALFRKLNITHSQLLGKYRQLSNEERNKYIAEYRDKSLHLRDNVTRELESLYGPTHSHSQDPRQSS